MKKQGLDVNDVMGIIGHMGGVSPTDIAEIAYTNVLKVFKNEGFDKHPKFVKVEQLLKEYRDHVAAAKNNGEAFERMNDIDKFICDERLTA